MVSQIRKNKLAIKRRKRVRGKMHGTAERPRLTIFRSNLHTYLQVIDDDQAKTIASANDKMLAKAGKKALSGTKVEKAKQITGNLVEQLKKLKVTKLAFDRGSFRYHGRLRAVAETLREAGIEV